MREILLITAIMLTLTGGILHYYDPTARGAGGTLYVEPYSRPFQPAGSIISYTIRVSNMEAFNGWDIMVISNQSSLDPQSISINSNLLSSYGSVQELANCVDGGGLSIPNGQPGNNKCNIDDGPGVAHSAAVLISGPPVGPHNGLLFNITYKTGSPPGSAIHIFNDVIASSGTSVPHNTRDASYGKPKPDFFMRINPTTLDVIAGATLRRDVSISSLANFTGSVRLDSKVSPTPDAVVSFNPPTLTLAPDITNTSKIVIATTLSSAVSTYKIDVNATSGSITHQIFLTLTISPARALFIIKDLSLSSASATVGDKVSVSVLLVNNGTLPGPLTLQIVWQGYLIVQNASQILPGDSKLSVFTWNTGGFPPGSSNVTARLTTYVKSVNFVLAPASTPFFADPLFLLVVAIVGVSSVFLFLRTRAHRTSKTNKKKR